MAFFGKALDIRLDNQAKAMTVCEERERDFPHNAVVNTRGVLYPAHRDELPPAQLPDVVPQWLLSHIFL